MLLGSMAYELIRLSNSHGNHQYDLGCFKQLKPPKTIFAKGAVSGLWLEMHGSPADLLGHSPDATRFAYVSNRHFVRQKPDSGEIVSEETIAP